MRGIRRRGPGRPVIDGTVACPLRRRDVSVEQCYACPYLRGAGLHDGVMHVRCGAEAGEKRDSLALLWGPRP